MSARVGLGIDAHRFGAGRPLMIGTVHAVRPYRGSSKLRIGHGFDAHAFSDARPLIVGGVEIAHPRGLVGHSDGDVVAHALCDALLAAIGGPDVGALFPPGDPRFEGASGASLLDTVADRVRAAGFRVANAHAVVVCEAPRLSPHRNAIQDALSAVVGGPVTVHATTTDGMGFTGRREGIACQAVALVEPLE